MVKIENKEAQEIFIEAGRLHEFYYYFHVLPEDVPESYSWWYDKAKGFLVMKLGGVDGSWEKIIGYYGMGDVKLTLRTRVLEMFEGVF